MQKHILFFLFLTFSFINFAQESSRIVQLKGQIVSAEDQKPLSAAHVINLNTVVGTITDDRGFFEIPTQVNDTIMVSYLGFQSIKLKITNDLLKGNELVIALYEKANEIKEVVIQSTKLIGVLEVDIKQVPKDRNTRIHINGLPQAYELGKAGGQNLNTPLKALFQPIDFLYSMFGKKPKQLKKLQKLKKEDDLRKMLNGKFDREIMMEYLDMDKQELGKLLADCNYSEYFISKASDLQMIEAILDCYENYKALKKGKIERNSIPDKKN